MSSLRPSGEQVGVCLLLCIGTVCIVLEVHHYIGYCTVHSCKGSLLKCTSLVCIVLYEIGNSHCLYCMAIVEL